MSDINMDTASFSANHFFLLFVSFSATGTSSSSSKYFKVLPLLKYHKMLLHWLLVYGKKTSPSFFNLFSTIISGNSQNWERQVASTPNQHDQYQMTKGKSAFSSGVSLSISTTLQDRPHIGVVGQQQRNSLVYFVDFWFVLLCLAFLS